MTKKNAMKSKTGRRELNPSDAYRKELRNKEKKRNKKERQKVREDALLRRNPLKIKEELTRLRQQYLSSSLDQKGQKKLEQLEEMWSTVKEQLVAEKRSYQHVLEEVDDPKTYNIEEEEGHQAPQALGEGWALNASSSAIQSFGNDGVPLPPPPLPVGVNGESANLAGFPLPPPAMIPPLPSGLPVPAYLTGANAIPQSVVGGDPMSCNMSPQPKELWGMYAMQMAAAAGNKGLYPPLPSASTPIISPYPMSPSMPGAPQPYARPMAHGSKHAEASTETRAIVPPSKPPNVAALFVPTQLRVQNRQAHPKPSANVSSINHVTAFSTGKNRASAAAPQQSLSLKKMVAKHGGAPIDDVFEAFLKEVDT